MKKWKRGLKRLTAVALAVMMVGTTVDFSAFAVSAAEGVSIKCTCETDDPAFHATNCPAYIAPENPQCTCAEKCTEDTLNIWCDVCGMQGVSACQDEDTAVAYEIVASGTCGAEGNESSVTWSLDSDGTLTISGSGAMADYELVDDYPYHYTTPWHDTDNDGKYQNSNIKKVVVEEGITHIGSSAFKDFTQLTSISIPNTVKSIGYGSVSYCYKLESLVIPDSVTSIGEEAFDQNIMLTSVTIGNSVESIGDYAFCRVGCDAGTNFTITLPKSVTYIAPSAFSSIYSGATIRYSCSYNEGNGYSAESTKATLEKYHLCEYSSSGNKINCSGCTCGEYSSSTATLSLSSDEPIYYTGEEIKPAVTVTYPDDWGGDKIEPNESNCTYSDNINAGAATCTFKYAEGVEASLDFTIQKATPTEEMFTHIESATYDGTEKSSNVVANQDITGMGEITIKYYQNDIEVTPVNVGTYTVKIDVAEGDNCTDIVGLEIGTFEITKVTQTADMFTYTSSAVYDGTAKSASVVARDGITSVGEITNTKYYQNGTEVTPINAGTYTVKIDVAEGDNYDAATDIEVGTFEITKATPTYDMFTATPSSELVYDGTEKSIIVTTDKEGMGTFNVSYNPSQPVDAGFYIIRLHIEEGDNYNAVDSLSFDWFEIKKANSVITAAPTPIADLEYDGTALNLINAGTTTDGEMQYSLDGTNYSPTIPTGTDAGEYTVWYKVDGDKSHNDTEPKKVEVTIAPKTVEIISVTASDRVFDGTNTVEITAVTLDAEVNNAEVDIDSVQGILVNDDGTVANGDAGTYSYVNLSGITLTGEDAGNYTIAATAEKVGLNGNVTINKATAQSLVNGSKAYIYSEAKTDETVTITGIPEDCGTVTYTYTEVDSSNMIENISVSDGVVTYDVNALEEYTEDIFATITVTIEMQNYNNLTYTYTITRSNCDHTEGKVVWDGKVGTDKAPTCTETGIGHTSCTKAGCGEVVETGITIPALGHDCESEVTTKATYTTEGVRTYTCKRNECDYSYTESIPKLTKPSGSGSSGSSSSTTNPPSTEAPSTEESSTEEPSIEDSSTEEPGTSEEDTVEWKTDENGTFYEKEDGTKVIGWYEMAEDVWYYFDENGYRQTGWEKDGENWYYLNENGVMQTGWVKDGESWYYLSESGAMKTGWVKDGEFWYYLGVNGAMKTGWVKDGETWYYLGVNGAMKTGWVKDGESWYYLSESGAMKTGWQKDGESWYYLNESGAMKTGWVKDGETWYYLSESGAMKTGWVKIGADWFYLNSNGSMAADTYIGKWYVDKNGYYIPSKTK